MTWRMMSAADARQCNLPRSCAKAVLAERLSRKPSDRARLRQSRPRMEYLHTAPGPCYRGRLGLNPSNATQTAAVPAAAVAVIAFGGPLLSWVPVIVFG